MNTICPSPRQLTPGQAGTLTLKRHQLTRPAERPLDVLRRLVAVQAQYAAGVPLALWARSRNLSPGWVGAALHEEKVLVKTWCLRGTIHVLASADLAMMVQAVGRQQVQEYEHFMQTRRGMARRQIQEQNGSILRALSRQPLARSELHAAVPELACLDGASWGLDVKGLALTGDLVVVDAGDARTGFARRDQWLPDLAWDLPAQEDARRELLRRYLTAYGPATTQDFAHWSGLKMKATQAVFAACAPDLLPVRVAGWAGDYYLCRQDEALLDAEDEAESALCLLPKFDPLLLGYRDKSRFIDEQFLPRVYRPAGQIEAVVLLAGRVAATWRTSWRGRKLTLTIAPFRPLLSPEHSLLRGAAEQLAAFLGAEDWELRA